MNKVRPEDAKEFDKAVKVGFLASVDKEGQPHVSLISSIMAKGEDQIIFGEFTEGESKKSIYERPNCGFFIMSLDKVFWTGKCSFTHSEREGEDYIHFNEMPLFRYNTYCGISVVHYSDLVDISEKRPLNMAGVILNALRIMLFKGLVSKSDKNILRPWAKKFLAGLVTLEFICYIAEDGFPKIVPIIQAQSAGTDRIAFTRAPYKDMLSDLKEGTYVAVYGLSLDMEAVEVKGTFHEGKAGICYVDIDKVYNPLPPKVGYVYPEENLKQEAITDWSVEPLVESLK